MRVLVVGLGNIGLKRRSVLGARCVGTVDPFVSGADFKTVEACPPERYDAAVLAVPNAVKLEMLDYLLRRGKHALVEKPLVFPDRATAERLDALAREHRAVWYTSYNFRFEPILIALKRYLDAGTIGRIYHGRLHYANGTVGNIVGSWRDVGLGVLADMASHLLDYLDFFFGYRGEVRPLLLARHEAKSLDHALLATVDGRFVLEASYLSWKNHFQLDFIGERGSLHVRGLSKWGPPELTIRERVFPSGAPRERMERAEGVDRTWEADTAYFEEQTRVGVSSMEKDWWISRTLLAAGAAA